MKRAALRTILWIAAAAWLYGALLLLDVYWNIVTWQPSWDGSAAALAASVLVGLGFIWALVRASVTALERAVGLVVSLGFLALAIHVVFPEALSEGLFARKAASPLWYRGLRLGVMSSPLLFWLCRSCKWPKPI